MVNVSKVKQQEAATRASQSSRQRLRSNTTNFSFRRPEAQTREHYRNLPLAQRGLMSLFQFLGMVGLHQRRASVDKLKTCPCKNGTFKKRKICFANCAIPEHEVKHEKPCAIRAFSPELAGTSNSPAVWKHGNLHAWE